MIKLIGENVREYLGDKMLVRVLNPDTKSNNRELNLITNKHRKKRRGKKGRFNFKKIQI